MPMHKGAGIVFLRERLKKESKKLDRELASKLNPEDAKIYQAAMAITQVPVEAVQRIYQTGVPMLYPGTEKAFYQFGHEQAHDNLRGIYKLFLKIASVPYVIGQTAKLWKTYHSDGKPIVEYDKTQNQASLRVEEYPALPEIIREVIRGYIAGGLALTGGKNIQVAREDRQKVWKWTATWE